MFYSYVIYKHVDEGTPSLSSLFLLSFYFCHLPNFVHQLSSPHLIHRQTPAFCDLQQGLHNGRQGRYPTTGHVKWKLVFDLKAQEYLDIQMTLERSKQKLFSDDKWLDFCVVRLKYMWLPVKCRQSIFFEGARIISSRLTPPITCGSAFLVNSNLVISSLANCAA